MRAHRLALVLLLALPATLPAAEAPRWRLHAGLSWVSGLELGCAVPDLTDPSTAPLTDRDYDDGFNRVDATNNMGDGPGGILSSRTGYFAFERDDQVDLAAGTLTLSSISASTDGAETLREAADTQGLNLGIRLDLHPEADLWHFGPVAEIDWHGRESTTITYDEAAPARRLTDSYALGGVVPQSAPYTGHYTPQPGDQRIGDIPTRAISVVDATLAGTQVMDHQITLARLGVWCERRLGERVALALEGGLAAGRIEADVAIADTVVVTTGLSSSRNLEASGSATPLGWYGGLRVDVALSPRWGIAGSYSRIDLGDASDGGVTFAATSLATTSVQLTWRF